MFARKELVYFVVVIPVTSFSESPRQCDHIWRKFAILASF